MMKRTDEKNLHSRFITILLDPRASHGLEDIYLRHFLSIVGVEFNYKLESLETYPNESCSTEYKNMDILLIDRQEKNAIIIENKIYASDSNHEKEGQLERYYRTIIEEGIPSKSISVIYLSLDREGPSIESVNTSKLYPELSEKVISINYNKEILKWLNECIKESSNKPLIRETIIQYYNLIEKMVNNVSEKQIDELMEVIGRHPDNLRGMQLLINSLQQIQEKSIWKFWSELIEVFEKNHFLIRKPISSQDCQRFFSNGLKSKKNFFLEITSNKGLRLTVNVDYQGCLCVGVTEEDGKGGQYQKAKSFYISNKDNLNLGNENGWVWYKIIDFPEEFCNNLDIFGHNHPTLDFVDYANDLYVNLISATERNRIVRHVYSEVEKVVTIYSDFRGLQN